MDKLTRTEVLEADIGGPAGNLEVTYATLLSLCGGSEVDGCLVTPSIRVTIWRRGKSFPTVRHAKARILGFLDLKEGDFLTIEPASGEQGRIRVVPVPRGCQELYTPRPRPKWPKPPSPTSSTPSTPPT
jgi:hypothetical protein